ncbi:hypothetical protein [Prevotella intermedia]|uniref:Uncharacterized protein n=1 Tax=Prevotella intermedia TaxID=28131 RepID=A0A3R8G9N4_PREIN|nr:hypothetical protein [Prevotella intermedia]RQE06879.1 hypothetical protein D2S53_00345 [Prevotella intermedia]RRF88341.1 hypothetical protein D2S45_00345 [Prevotella intermedia]
MRRIKIEARDGQQKPTISPKELVGAIMTEAKQQSQFPHNLVPEHRRVDAPQFKTYRIKGDEHKIVAYSPEEFLRQLHAGSRFDSEGTDAEYMQHFALRLQELEGYLVSTDSPAAFLADLISHGFVSIE